MAKRYTEIELRNLTKKKICNTGSKAKISDSFKLANCLFFIQRKNISINKSERAKIGNLFVKSGKLCLAIGCWILTH